MRHQILLAPEAVQDLHSLKASLRAEVRDTIGRHLRHEPTRTSRTRIQEIEGEGSPQYRLRVGDVRVYYDVSANEVRILAIVPKEGFEDWLRKVGKSR